MTSAVSACRMLLVRHGESEWNAQHRWQGQADPPLTELGEAQARAAGAAASEIGPFDAVVTSTLERAARTGDLIAEALGADAVGRDRALIERFAGPWQGLTRAEIEAAYPGYLAAGRRPEGYEDDQAIVERCGTALGELAVAHAGGTVLVVSHGGVINALERHRGEEWLRIGNLEGRWFDVSARGGSDVEPRDRSAVDITPIGDRVHLIDAPSPSSSVDPADRGYA